MVRTRSPTNKLNSNLIEQQEIKKLVRLGNGCKKPVTRAMAKKLGNHLPNAVLDAAPVLGIGQGFRNSRRNSVGSTVKTANCQKKAVQKQPHKNAAKRPIEKTPQVAETPAKKRRGRAAKAQANCQITAENPAPVTLVEFIELFSAVTKEKFAITVSNVAAMLKLAARLSVPSVTEKCEEFLMDCPTGSDRGGLPLATKLALSQEYRLDGLKNWCGSQPKADDWANTPDVKPVIRANLEKKPLKHVLRAPEIVRNNPDSPSVVEFGLRRSERNRIPRLDPGLLQTALYTTDIDGNMTLIGVNEVTVNDKLLMKHLTADPKTAFDMEQNLKKFKREMKKEVKFEWAEKICY